MQVFAAADASRWVPVIQAAFRDGHLVVTADRPVGHTADTGPGGLTGALGRWPRFGTRAGMTPGGLRPVPPVWCSWYQYYDAVTEADIAANLAAMDDLGLGFGVVQIDDAYQAAPGDWLVPSGRFAPARPGAPDPRDRPRAGIWIAPLLLGQRSRTMREHPEWAVRHAETGEPVAAGRVVRQECTALDVTHPGAARYLSGVLATMREWGIDYVKADFLYAGACEGVRHDQVSGVEASAGGCA